MADISFAVRTHTGFVRENNEDSYYCNLDDRVFAVCDGMGGEDDGEIASQTVTEVLSQYSKRLNLAVINDDEIKIDAEVKNFVNEANRKLCDIMANTHKRMGTTLVLSIISENYAYSYNLGDSRLYLFHGDRLIQLSEDHTVAAQKWLLGYISRRKAETSRERHILTRYLGISERDMLLTPDKIAKIPINQKSRILLCSDGLYEMLTYHEIAEILRTENDTEKAVNLLTENALNNGGKDNITCILIDIKGV